MARLAEYLADYALLLGNNPAVHFRKIEDGSAELVSDVDVPELPTVRKRALDAEKGFGPSEAESPLRLQMRRWKMPKQSPKKITNEKPIPPIPLPFKEVMKGVLKVKPPEKVKKSPAEKEPR
jgi:hypothetical protein